MPMGDAVGTGGWFATVTGIVTAPDSGGVPLSVTVIVRLSLPVKLSAGVYVTTPLASMLAVPCAGSVVTAKVKVPASSGSLGLTWLVPGVFRVVRMAGAVGTGAVLGGAATVTAIVTARVRGGVPLSDTVMTRLSVPVKPMAGIY